MALRPPVSLLMTPSLCARSLFVSIFGLLNVTPASASSGASLTTSAMCNKALEGIQPTFRQTPPSTSSFSIKITFLPKSAARKAAV